VQAQTIGDFALGIALLLHRFADLLVPHRFALKNLLGKDLLLPGTARIPLAFGNIGDGFLFSEVAPKLLDKFFPPKENLPSHCLPDGFFSYSSLYIVSVSLLSFPSCSAELPKHPLGGQTPMGRRSSRRAQVAGPFPVFRPLRQTRPDRVQDDIPADFQQMALFLDVDGLVSPLEQVTTSSAPRVEALRIDAV
jgi:hypothetical protein